MVIVRPLAPQPFSGFFGILLLPHRSPLSLLLNLASRHPFERSAGVLSVWFFAFMSEPTLEELQQSIDELIAYRDRLHQDVVSMGRKLKLPQKRIDATVSEHPELQRLGEVLEQLLIHRDALLGS